MSSPKKEIRNFTVIALLISIVVIILIRLFVMYNNKTFATFVNILFFASLFFLIIGFINILIVNLKEESKRKKTNRLIKKKADKQSDVDEYPYKDFLNLTTLMIAIGILLVIVSFFLALIISFIGKT